ncbi:hypothetical protein PHYBLDRAFT_130768 [Phycomyces blakesleeanus NRRL 1555(-)]|uniref:Bromo domain-containing protein n=1 Tax=Phycomyces blakesleeanus (strain ATCC 8743b / DSM 1359 / FGSC 10004 / NBRC 33097 / NRRL 1555) TaxID=763407 RepID=A0A162Y6E1_PHYB8|nr:hypothetical protein PHYBLDRAFT_130768 [Phycomyces blakesleeanus NRRL 1555(-)]OAD78555.1 hypothetical protein PHYBLDRAFT_130768 [Phycomyces blakesleeanus NRRL 1555(-)]|eukprot:XP_018296595.1 hypothetical protein PHYBLDRAFT_130768 [Phycomyces blakesleeanus NRRL 1555(-)]
MSTKFDRMNSPSNEQTGSPKNTRSGSEEEMAVTKKNETTAVSMMALPSPAAEVSMGELRAAKPSSTTTTNGNKQQKSSTSTSSSLLLSSSPSSSSFSPSFYPPTQMTRDQLKYSAAITRELKKHRDAAPFLHPVDYVKMNVPDYPKVVRHPMDLTTVDRKLSRGQYVDVDAFVADVRLVFNNCYKFNGPEAMISMLCQNVESAFEKSMRQMPPSKEVNKKKLYFIFY